MIYQMRVGAATQKILSPLQRSNTRNAERIEDKNQPTRNAIRIQQQHKTMNCYPNDILLGVSPTVFAASFNTENPKDEADSLSNVRFNRLLNSMTAPRGTSATDEQTSFWTRARIVPVGNRHEFPKLKNPNIKQSYQTKCKLGILPSRWLTKHSRGLPSVLLVVFEVSKTTLLEFESEDHQALTHTTSQELKVSPGSRKVSQLAEMVQRLRASLGAKRECKLYLICLVTDDPPSSSSESEGGNAVNANAEKQLGLSSISSVRIDPNFYKDNIFLKSVLAQCRVSSHMLTVLQQVDLEVPIINEHEYPLAKHEKSTMRSLLKNIREASMHYYLTAARRAKRKERALVSSTSASSFLHYSSGDNSQPNKEYVTLAVRYNFKIAIFYEFMGNKVDKCVKHYSDAYKALEVYYCFIMGVMAGRPKQSPISPSSNGPTRVLSPQYNRDSGVEVSLASPTAGNDNPSLTRITINESIRKNRSIGRTEEIDQLDYSPDMIFQCQGVADWLNLKLLRLAFGVTSPAMSSKQPKNIESAAIQWRRHCQVFLNKYHPVNAQSHFLEQPTWHYLSNVAHQRLLVAQLTERSPLQADQYRATVTDIVANCSPWRQYASTAEVMLRLYTEIEKIKIESSELKDMPAPLLNSTVFVGGFSSSDLSSALTHEIKKNHVESALEYAQRAIQIFEKGTPQSDKNYSKHSFGNLVTRLYFLTGRLLMIMENYDMAIQYLNQAYSAAKLWPPIEVAVGKIILNCLQLLTGENSKEEIKTNISTDILLNRRTNAFMAHDDLKMLSDEVFGCRKTMQAVSSEKCFAISDASTPFSFSLVFPESTYVEAGDEADVIVRVVSKLRTPLRMLRVQVCFLFDTILADIPSDGIVLEPEKVVFLRAKLYLPKHRAIGSTLNRLGGVRVRPYCSGLTQAGGGVYSFRSTESPRGGSSREIGGFPVSSHCIKLSLCTPNCSSLTRTITLLAPDCVDCSVKKDESFYESLRAEYKTSTTRHPDDYVVSAWNPGPHLEIGNGPCCLRVLDPLPFLEITNITHPQTKGVALGGTIHRIILEVKAGKSERCRNLKMHVQCHNTFISISPKEEDGSVVVLADANESGQPFLVVQDEDSRHFTTTRAHDSLPAGWRMVEEWSEEDSILVTSYLPEKQATYVHFDIYRPPPVNISEPEIAEDSICKTEYLVTFQYEQTRKEHLSPDFVGKIVTCSHLNEIIWKDPVTLEFSCANLRIDGFPSGCNLSNNNCSDLGKRKDFDTPSFEEVDNIAGKKSVHLVNGKTVQVHCSLSSAQSNAGLFVAIDSVTFESSEDENYKLVLVSHLAAGKEKKHIIFVAPCSDSIDTTNLLQDETKLGLSFALKADIRDKMKSHIQSRLGCMTINWTPIPVKLSSNVNLARINNASAFSGLHGSLPLTTKVKLNGPKFDLHRESFQVSLISIPVSPKVATRFEVKYDVKNLSNQHQKLIIAMSEACAEDDETQPHNVLFSGLLNGEISLGPFESKNIGYSALAFRVGKTKLPTFTVASARHRTWLINESAAQRRSVYVLP